MFTPIISRDGRWFEIDLRFELGRRPVLVRLLEALARHRLEAAGSPISVPTLVSVVWPGERMPKDVALNRLYVSVATLRRLGLDSVLETREGGYRLSPNVVIATS